ncbi:MAG TPA: hypothetical protein VFN57_15090 [Thermomicrobiaceae bacterium]|nr:hypothetical protein [Thermomicrobiaceae bacterium]
MDASVTSALQWTQVTSGLVWFWTFLSCMITFAASLLLAHAAIPSLVSTHQLSRRMLNVRPIFYALAILFLMAAIFSFANIIVHLQVLWNLYGKIWV